MAAKSKIEWTGSTWNLMSGCTKISSGCENCYAEKMAIRLQSMKCDGYQDGFKVTLHPEKLEVPLKTKKATMFFVCSMGDLFHDDVPDDFIITVFNVMANAHAINGHTFQVLTKRPERMRDIIKKIEINLQEQRKPVKKENGFIERTTTFSFPLKGVWLGVTAENQKEANHRIPILLDTPAALRFVSIEPMLERIDLENVRDPNQLPGTLQKHILRGHNIHLDDDCFYSEGNKIDWVICGGESGQKARPLDPSWVKSLQKQCVNANTPFFFKQWGEFTCRDGEMIRVGKKEAGYLIDGKECREMPMKGN